MEILKSNSAGLSPAYVVESEAMPWFRSSLWHGVTLPIYQLANLAIRTSFIAVTTIVLLQLAPSVQIAVLQIV